jgi:hypothetical protein
VSLRTLSSLETVRSRVPAASDQGLFNY